MTEVECPFCRVEIERVFHVGEHVLGLWDAFPVSPGHALLVTKRHLATWFDASAEERAELTEAVSAARTAILQRHQPDGFNVGVNVGESAGQTVFHLHLHVIPRYRGDVPDPRGGLRRVIPNRARYWPADTGDGKVSETSARFTSQPQAYQAGQVATDSGTGTPDAAAFAERIFQLLGEGRFTATYKYAVLLALIDLCVERSENGKPPASLHTRDLANKIVELYWPHTARFQGRSGAVVLAQNVQGQAEILRMIGRFRERYAEDPSQPLSRARHKAPRRFENLVSNVEWKLIEMPLPRLQVVGDTTLSFLYNIGWTTDVKRGDLEQSSFDRNVHLHPGVAEQLVQLASLLRPVVQGQWAAMVARLNKESTDEGKLEEFLFGAERISTEPVRGDLRELQNDRCFYCDGKLAGMVHVDHFMPWARHADNGIDNLVVADERCNLNKKDFLAAGQHVERWSRRFDPADALASQLANIAQRAAWDHHPQRTLNVARTIYLRLPEDFSLWLRRREFVPVEKERAIIVSALASS